MGTKKEKRTCSVEGCTGDLRAKEMCWAHYVQLRRHGKTGPLRPPPMEDPRSVSVTLERRDVNLLKEATGQKSCGLALKALAAGVLSGRVKWVAP